MAEQCRARVWITPHYIRSYRCTRIATGHAKGVPLCTQHRSKARLARVELAGGGTVTTNEEG